VSPQRKLPCKFSSGPHRCSTIPKLSETRYAHSFEVSSQQDLGPCRAIYANHSCKIFPFIFQWAFHQYFKIWFLRDTRAHKVYRCYNDQPLNVPQGEITATCCKNHTKHTNTTCRKNAGPSLRYSRLPMYLPTCLKQLLLWYLDPLPSNSSNFLFIYILPFYNLLKILKESNLVKGMDVNICGSTTAIAR
jgi:hypothetical protein